MPYNENKSIELKIVILGSSGVGKTSQINKYIYDTFTVGLPSSNGPSFFSKQITHNDIDYKLNIWDTAGQERYRTITSLYYKDAHGVLLVGDVTNDSSIKELDTWFYDVKDNAPKNVSVCICGNKTDLLDDEDNLKMENHIRSFSENKKCSYLMTSALQGSNIDEAFISIIEGYTAKKEEHDCNTQEYSKLYNATTKTEKKKGCCA